MYPSTKIIKAYLFAGSYHAGGKHTQPLAFPEHKDIEQNGPRHLAVSTSFVTTASAETLNSTIFGVTVFSPPCSAK